MSMSTAAPKRLRLLPPYQLIGLALLLVLLLFLVFPRASLETRLLGQQQSDQLAIAYLEAWQRIEPDNPEVLRTLAHKYLKEQRMGDAWRLITRLRKSHDPQARREALWLEIGLAQSALFASTKSVVRHAYSVYLARLLGQAPSFTWQNDQLAALANAARAIGYFELADGFYLRLTQQEPARADFWWRTLCSVRLARQHYALAAEACFAAQAHAVTRQAQRQDFIAALRALQMGNQLDQAMAAARQHQHALLNDIPTLRFLTHLALASGRPDLAQDYVRRLLNVQRSTASTPQPIRPEASASYQPVSWRQGTQATVLSDWESIAPIPVKLNAPPMAPPIDEDDLDLAYRVFMANGKLAEAQRVAQQALDQHFNPQRWRVRLAQTALWNNDPVTALTYYLLIAEQGQDEALWQQVEALANSLNDTSAQLRVYRHDLRQHPGDLTLIDKIVKTYEQRSEPETALDFLRQQSQGPNRAAILSRRALLAQRAGHDQLAMDIWQSLQGLDGPKPAYALPLAQYAYQQGRLADALAGLRSAERVAASSEEAYWRFYARLASLLQDSDALKQVGAHLSADGGADDQTRQSWLETLDEKPTEYADTAWRFYQQTGHPDWLARAISADTRRGVFERIQSLFAQWDAPARTRAQTSVDFLLARAEFYRLMGEPIWAQADWARAHQLAPQRVDVIAAELWGLMATGQTAVLRQRMAQYAALAHSDPVLLSVYADAQLVLGEPRAALHYFALARPGRERDPLWLLTYADALALASRPGAAWQLRRHVWRDLLPNKLSMTRPPESRDSLWANLVSLNSNFTGADQSLKLLRAGLLPPDSEPGILPPQRVAAAAAWAQTFDAEALMQYWLARHTPHAAMRPASIRLASALAEQDADALEQVLARQNGPLSSESRIEALSSMERHAEAQSELFDAITSQAANDDLQQRLQTEWLDAAQGVSTSWRSVRLSGLRYDQFGLMARHRLASQQALQWSLSERYQRSDASVLPQMPEQDRTLALSYRLERDRTRHVLTLASRHGWRTVTPVRWEGALRQQNTLSFDYALGYAQAADETSQLLLAGIKHFVSMGASWRQGPWFVNGRLEADRFYLQDRSFLGVGYQTNVEAGYKFRLSYPDITLRWVGLHGQYRASGAPSVAAQSLLPASANGQAAAFLPQTFSQSGLLLSVGAEHAEGRRRPFRPFLTVGPMYDSNAHWGKTLLAGFAGAIAGRDRLSLYYQHQDMSAQGASAATEIGVRYHWTY